MNANLQAALIDAENGKRSERRELMREYGSLIYQREQTPADASRIQNLMESLGKSRTGLEDDLKIVEEAHRLEDSIARGTGLEKQFQAKSARFIELQQAHKDALEKCLRELGEARMEAENTRQRMSDGKSAGENLARLRARNIELLDGAPLVEWQR